MAKIRDITGDRYGRLIVLGLSPFTSRRPRWVCLCDCGAVVTAGGNQLQKGDRKSCGCLQAENPGAQIQRIRAMVLEIATL